MSNALVVHGGGPTAVMNASLAGLVEECAKQSRITSLYGSAHGVTGILNGRLVDLFAQPASIWRAAALAPGSLLGSSRQKVDERQIEQIGALIQKRDIRLLFLNGGNGTMSLALRLSEWSRQTGFDLAVIGIPKTIDNDLYGTDHSPGYGSAARFFALALRDIGADNRSLPGITVVEVLGRNAGWLAAATLLAKSREGDAPHLVYLPEKALPLDSFLADVERVYRRFGRAVIAVCEGQLNEKGEPFGADVRTSSRAPLALNLAHVLSKHIAAGLGVPARSEKPGLLGRSCAALASSIDREEARQCGIAAVSAALSGTTGQMVTLVRHDDAAYKSSTGLADLHEVAGRERLLPAEWVERSAEEDMPRFREWAAPLTGGIEGLPVLTDVCPA